MTPVLHTIIETSAYLVQASKIMTDEERAAVVDMISTDPSSGAVIKGTRGLRKVRIPLQGRGKSGGARVIYWFHSSKYPAALLWVFAKNSAANLTASQAAALAKLGDDIINTIGAT